MLRFRERVRPVTAPILNRARLFADSIRGVSWMDRELVSATFKGHYEKQVWRFGSSVSGLGSDDAETAQIREVLPAIFREFGVRTLVDVPCGDANWITQIDDELEHYTGIDVVEPLIAEVAARYAAPHRTFLVGDLCRDPLPQADAVLCRDCLMHLPFGAIRAALDNIRASGATWLITTTYPDHRFNFDCPVGRWRALNLCARPFSFSPPDRLIADRPNRERGLAGEQEYRGDDGGGLDGTTIAMRRATARADAGKSLGVWRVAQLDW